MRRSQVAFIRGAWTAVRRILVPVAWKTASKEAVKFEPWSRIRNLMSSNGTVALSDPMIIGQEDLSPAGARRPPDARFSLPDGLRAYT